MNFKTELLLDGLMFPEGPRWHQDQLWFTDQHAQQIKAVDINGNAQLIAELSDLPGGLGWLPDGRLLVVSMCNRQLLVLEQDKLSLFADLSKLASFHCNDLLVDQQGRSYVGNFGYDLHGGADLSTAEIILVSAEGKPKIVSTEVVFPNGMVITPDRNTLIVAETFASRLSSFSIQSDGSLGQRELWANLDGAFPDGICLDQKNGIWVACPNTGDVIRVEQGGIITDNVKAIGNAYACMLGGTERNTLFVLTSETDDPKEAVRTRSGRIEVVDVSVPGVGLP
jgi:sugar lactone lactonase YvrE